MPPTKGDSAAGRLAQAIANPFAAVEGLRTRHINTSRATNLEERFRALYQRHLLRINNLKHGVGVAQLQEGAMIAVTGATQAGKTREIAHLFQQFPEFAGYEDIRNGAPLISLRAPPACTAKRLAHELVDRLGFPLKSQWAEHALWKEVHTRLQVNKISVVHIDEMQHATQVANEREILRLGASLKGLLLNPDWPILLVVSGVPTLEVFLRSYPELLRRTHYIRFNDIGFEDAANVTAVASAICGNVGLELRANDLECERFGERLIAAAGRQLGGVFEWTIDAVGVALLRLAKESDPERRCDAQIDHYDFAAAYQDRKDCRPVANIFLSPRWEDVDPATARLPEEQQPLDTNERRPSPRRRSRRK